MTRVLLTGFEPFGGDAFNPSREVVRFLAQTWSGPGEIVADVLPVAFDEAGRRLRALIERHSPDVVLATGLAGGRAVVGVERIAVNLIDARIPDNDGAQPVDEPSVPGAPAARFATLPVKRIARDLVAAGVPAEVSHSAGTYVCNHVFYTALDAAPVGVRAGFLHLPWTAEHAPARDAASLSFFDVARGVTVAIETAIAHDDDVRVPAGAIH
ncbi:pyroglutamyl-peptidase I [Microbacterium aureliae]